uniref:Uncharacterized protein n=1 Tax=Rhizophora mucronata TaxID=61149 RepID=A0A2P2MAV3_RHIMU
MPYHIQVPLVLLQTKAKDYTTVNSISNVSFQKHMFHISQLMSRGRES